MTTDPKLQAAVDQLYSAAQAVIANGGDRDLIALTIIHALRDQSTEDCGLKTEDSPHD